MTRTLGSASDETAARDVGSPGMLPGNGRQRAAAGVAAPPPVAPGAPGVGLIAVVPGLAAGLERLAACPGSTGRTMSFSPAFWKRSVMAMLRPGMAGLSSPTSCRCGPSASSVVMPLPGIVMPPALTPHMGKLIEFNTSCASVFTQRAGIAAIEGTDRVTPRVVEHLRQCRDVLLPRLVALPRVRVALPSGGMYAFFRLDGFDDSLNVAKRLVIEVGLGLAPGNAFGPEAQGWLRWCFASRETARLGQGVERLKKWLGL